MKELERYGTTINGIEWEIDFERKRLVGIGKPKLVRKLNKTEIEHIRKLIKEKNGRKNKMRNLQ